MSPVCDRAAIESCTRPAGMSPGHPRHTGEESDRSQIPIPIPKQKQTPNQMMKERATTNRVHADMLKHHLKRPARESTELTCYPYWVVRVSTLPTYNPQASTNKISQTTRLRAARPVCAPVNLCSHCSIASQVTVSAESFDQLN